MFGFFDKYFLFFGLKVYYYGFIMAIAMLIGVFVACKNAKKRGLKNEDLIVGALYVLPLAVIGARIYYVLFSLDQYTSFVDVLRVWDGGMAIYGGVIGGAIGVALFCLIHKHNFFDVADVVVPCLILGQAIGRVGCCFSQCCYGWEVTGTGAAWFPLSMEIDGKWYLATQIYEIVWDMIGFTIMMLLLYKFNVKQKGAVMASYFIIYGAGRAVIETFRGDSLYLGAIKVSQLLSILLVVLGVGIILGVYLYNKKKAVKQQPVQVEQNDDIKNVD